MDNLYPKKTYNTKYPERGFRKYMEDTKVCKGHYAYMFRVDLSNNQEASSRIEDWLEVFSFTNWTGCHEIGDETGKPHYQMIVWREHKFTQPEQTKARNWWRNKTISKKNGCALTSARKVASLASYSQKNSENSKKFSTVCNLSSDQLSRIPRWESKRALKVKREEKFNSTIKSMGKSLPKIEFLAKINQVYFEVYSRPCLFKNTYIKCLYNNGYITDQEIVALTLGIMLPREILEEDNDDYDGYEAHYKSKLVKYYKSI